MALKPFRKQGVIGRFNSALGAPEECAKLKAVNKELCEYS
jgi:hypothetical protein